MSGPHGTLHPARCHRMLPAPASIRSTHSHPAHSTPRPPAQDLAHTLRTKLAGQPRFSAPRRQQHAFVVDHYAGEVCYSAEHMMDKNKVRAVAARRRQLLRQGVLL